MESKTKHRLLGVLVVIGLIVILFPFFQSNKDFSKEAKAVTAPPFPDQSVQVSMNDDLGENLEEQAIPIPPNELVQTQAEEVSQKPDDTINVAQTSLDHEQPHEPPLVEESPIKVAEVKATQDVQPVKEVKEIKAVEPPPVPKPKIKVASKTNVPKIVAPKKPLPQTPLDDDGLVKLKNAAWVIQLGSFNKKENALRLVNQLRANGYRAFIQEVSTRLGSTTRVFVGPEVQHDQARALAIQLESDLHLHGMVISYKPLTL